MKDPRDIQRAWLRRANQAEDDFDKFIYAWFAFNALYSPFLNEGVSERRAIKDSHWACMKDQRVKEEMGQIVNLSAANFFSSRIIRDCRGKESQGNTTYDSACKLKDTRNGITFRVEALLMILYQVRCNLFHGNKVYGNESDDRVMKNAAAALIAYLLIIIGGTEEQQ